MHSGKPYGLHVVGKQLTPKDEAFISASARKLGNLKDISGVESLRLVYDLPDGGYFIVQDMGGNFRVIAHKPIHDTNVITTNGLATTYIPMLFSSAIIGRTTLNAGVGLSMNISQTTRKRMFNYDGRLAPKQLTLNRFACEYGPLFQEFIPASPTSELIYTQYGEQRPTWYTGAMAEVMQIVGGYGRQDFQALPDSEIERAVLTLPDDTKELIEQQLGSVRLPAYTGLPNEKGQFQYDYKYLNTNIISFDDNNEPWLIKIDMSGVWAMPLPIVPATSTSAFYNYMQEVGDDEILAILDRFGAMPSGESFPLSASAFQAWVRAGVIIKIGGTADFYENMPYSSAMGWSANTTGTEIVNTCYNLDLATGKLRGKTYKLRLRLTKAKNKGWAGALDYSLFGDNAAQINSYFSFVYERIAIDNPINNAIKYKLRVAPPELITERMVGQYNESEIDYWNNIELPAIALHNCNVVKIGDGDFYGGREVKVPEPFFKTCVSLPSPLPIPGNIPTKFDTIVLAYFLGDSLKTVRMFNDPTENYVPTVNNFEDFMYVGSWQETSSSGMAGLQGSVYTSDIDKREMVAPSEYTTTIQGRDLGYSQPHHSFDFLFWRTGDFYRFRHYTTQTNTVATYGRTVMPAVAMPYFCRDIIIYAQRNSYDSKVETESLVAGSLRDPNNYRFWTDAQSLFLFGNLAVQKGKPYPVEGRPNWAEILETNPSNEYNWADSGAWLGGLPVDITKMMYQYENVIWGKESHPPAPTVNTYSKTTSKNNGSDMMLLCQVFDQVDRVRVGDHNDDYYQLAVGGSDPTFYRDASKVVFGNNKYANISEHNDTGNRKSWHETQLADSKTAHHFTGVINE